jgi:hypothetical protein
MRTLVLTIAAALLLALAVAFAAGGGVAAARKPGLTAAVERTQSASSLHYVIHVALVRRPMRLTLQIHGQASAHTISVRMKMGDVRLADGTVVPGPDGAALLDGPFLYERAPSDIAVGGKLHWLRLSTATRTASAGDLAAVHTMTPAPLLAILHAAHVAPAAPGTHVFHGSLGYDDPIMHRLAKFTGNVQYRRLRISAVVGVDGFVHRIVLTGRTPDGASTLSLRARLFAIGKPVHVTPPAPGTFMDEQLARLPA